MGVGNPSHAYQTSGHGNAPPMNQYSAPMPRTIPFSQGMGNQFPARMNGMNPLPDYSLGPGIMQRLDQLAALQRQQEELMNQFHMAGPAMKPEFQTGMEQTNYQSFGSLQSRSNLAGLTMDNPLESYVVQASGQEGPSQSNNVYQTPQTAPMLSAQGMNNFSSPQVTPNQAGQTGMHTNNDLPNNTTTPPISNGTIKNPYTSPGNTFSALLKDKGSTKGKRKGVRSRRGPRSPDEKASRSSKYRGVTKHRRSGRYEAHIWVKELGRQVYLGGYECEEHAAEAYDIAALKSKGTKTKINFDISKYSDLLSCVDRMSMEELVMSVRRQSQGFSRGTSSYRGVTHHPSGRWEARIGIPGSKHVYLGLFQEEKDAATAYDRALVRLRGQAAATNFQMADYKLELSDFYSMQFRMQQNDPRCDELLSNASEFDKWVKNGTQQFPWMTASQEEIASFSHSADPVQQLATNENQNPSIYGNQMGDNFFMNAQA